MQIHKRFNEEQVAVLLKGYCQGTIDRTTVEETLGIAKSRFFVILAKYRCNQDKFSLLYHRESPTRLPAGIEDAIEKELKLEKALVDDPSLPISGYNYSAILDRLTKQGIKVSLSTVINRAKSLSCYQSHPRKKTHNREVITNSIGALIQHDASHHRWSPYAKEKWVLITSIDDFSRKLLYANLFEEETTWSHIQAAETLIHSYGIPLSYYVDSLRVFRFVQNRDSVWKKQVLKTDEVDPQWKQVMKVLGVNVTYALSPQAKGKVERPYQWLQDRIVRTCALEKISAMEDVRAVLREEVDRYNHHQVHSTTKEIPSIRFTKARKDGNSLFRPFSLPKPYTSAKDVFCLRETRVVNGYRRISLFNHTIEVPKADLYEEVEIHLVPDAAKQVMEARIWWKDKMVHSVALPLEGFRVHL